MEEKNIKKSLRQCKKTAGAGYKMAMKQYQSLKETLSEAEQDVKGTLIEINTSPCYVSEATESLAEQLKQIEQSIGFITASLADDIASLHEDLEKFSITLFGRTMAGKSTLMEVLTEGDGQAIGKGAQRTTLDVRTYPWNNLEITDVPGIGAFQGADDENIAFNAARKGDLILFLLTDDAPQATEAECFREIMGLGKPVICVMNVKSSMRDGENIKMTVRNMEKAFNSERLEAIRAQFLSFAPTYGQDWSNIPFVYVHLKAAFAAQNAQDAETAQILNNASHIDDFKSKIIEEVENHGRYYREKTFVDIVSIPTIDIFEALLFQGAVNQKLKGIVDYKRKQLDEWTAKFKRDSSQAIVSLIGTIQAELNMEIPEFVEEHYADKKADEAWNKVLLDNSVEVRCKELSEKLITQSEDKLNELSREISKELQYVSAAMNRSNLQVSKMKPIFDAKKAWNWGSLIAGGGLTIAGGILWLLGNAAAGPVGWIALGVSAIGTIGSFIFKSRDKKEDQAKKKLEESLQKNVESVCSSLREQMTSILEKLLSERIRAQSDEIGRISAVIDRLSNTQASLAQKMQPVLLEQNKQIMSGALKMVWSNLYASRIKTVGRVPGNLLVAVMKENEKLPEKKTLKLQGLIQEDLIYISETANILSELLGVHYEQVDSSANVLNVSVENPSSDFINRSRIAKQLMCVYIGNEKETNYA